MNSNSATLFAFFEFSRTVASTYSAGVVLFAIGLLAAKRDVAEARGLDKIVALGNLCFAAPLGVFAAEHFSAAKGISQLVPKFMPWPLFWTYFVGVALLAASLSIATRIQVHWSGLGIGIMMFIFVSTMDIPGTLANLHNRIIWALLARELSFGCGGLVLAAGVSDGWSPSFRSALYTFGRVVIGVAAVFYGVEHFLHPTNVPGVPLEKFMPDWIPARMLISYITGVFLVVGGGFILLGQKVRMAATYLGSWIFLVVFTVYAAILIASMFDPSTDVKVEGVNYFFDTLLYAGTILAVAQTAPHAD